MEQTNISACKYILTTYESNDGSKCYDTIFHLRPPFKPNSSGVYKITINEAFFINNEATFRAGFDYIKFVCKFDDGTAEEVYIKIIKDYFIYGSFTSNSLEQFKKILQGTNETFTNLIKPDTITFSISLLENVGGNILRDLNAEAKAEIPQNLIYRISATKSGTNLNSIEMSYTSNFSYVLNNLNKTLTSIDGNFNFYNLRYCGPYLYVLDTPLKSTVNTYNANNNGYNIVACAYNTADSHNNIVQAISSMELTATDLSNLRFRLLNDQMELVHIFSPIYIQMTISNEG